VDVVVERCAGLDVHRDNVVATVRVPSEDRGRWERETRTFKATLGGLAELREWLVGFAVTLVGMEATGDPRPRQHPTPLIAERLTHPPNCRTRVLPGTAIYVRVS